MDPNPDLGGQGRLLKEGSMSEGSEDESLPSLGRPSKMRESVAPWKLKWPSVGAETGRRGEAESSGC